MGSELSDDAFYRERRLFGGLAYSDQDLLRAFDWLESVELRRMEHRQADSKTFGQSILLAGLFRRGEA